MRFFRSIVRSAVLAMTLAAPGYAQPGSGIEWEISTQMQGMPDMGFAMPKQRTCMSTDTNEAPPTKQECTVLDQRSDGNHHWMKMKCPDGLMEMDQTRDASSLQSHIKMTDKSGEVVEMTMNGKVIGECDYAAEQRAQEQMIGDMQAKGAAVQRDLAAKMQEMCTDALNKMNGQQLFAGIGKDGCAKQQKDEYCSRLKTLDGYQGMMKNVRPEFVDSPTYGVAPQVQPCGLKPAGLLQQHCATASKGANFQFVGRYCPQQIAGLCSQALGAEQLSYIGRHCPSQRQELVAKHCAGRKYSSDIEERYRGFCSSAHVGGDFDEDGSGNSDADSPASVSDAAADATPKQPVDQVKQGVKKGVKGLKKVFGF